MQPLNRVPQHYYHIRVPCAHPNSNLILPSFLFLQTRDSQSWIDSAFSCYMAWYLTSPSWILLWTHLHPDLHPYSTFSRPLTSVCSDVWLPLNNIWHCFVCACLIDILSHCLSYFSMLPVMFDIIMVANDSTFPQWLCLGSWPGTTLPAGTQVIA